MESLRWTSLLLVIFATSISVEAHILPFEEAFLTYDPAHSSSEGNQFVVGFMANGDPPDPREPDRPGNAYIIVSTRDTDQVSFTVTRLFDDDDATRVSTHTVTHNQTIKVTFPPDDVIIEGAERNKAIGVKAAEGKKISVYVVSDEFRSTDGYVALPCDAMVVPGDYRRYEYIIHSTSQMPTGDVSQRFSQILLIACFDDSRASVTPSQSITPPGNSFSPAECGPDPPNPPTSCAWDERGAMDTVLITSADDLTGTIIRSEKPLVVVTGHQCGEVPRGNTACDFIAEQLPPHNTWGYTHILVPLAVRRTGDYYRIAAYLDGTVVNITCVDFGSSSPSTVTYTLDRMDVQTHTTHTTVDCSDSFRYQYCILQASKPVSVTQYSYGYSRDRTCFGSEIGDPFISVVPPITQYMNKYTFTEVEGDAGDFTTFSYINVAVHQSFFDPSRIFMDDSLLEADGSKWQAVYCPDGDICGYAITKSISGVGNHTVYHSREDAGIYVHLYGFQNQNSYGFPIGMELEPIAGSVIICAPPDSCIPEGESRTITCTRTLDLDFGSRFTVTSEDGTAVAGTDYTAVNTPEIRFTRGNAQIRDSDSIDVTTLMDGDDEEEETFYLNFNPTRNALFIPTRIEIKICGRTVTVEPVTVSFDPTTYTVTEGVDGVANLMLVRSGGLTRTVVVTVTTAAGTATAGSDYTHGVTTVTFGPDVTSASHSVPILDDSNIEDTETFTATLSTTESNVNIGDDTATITILDDDMCPDLTAPANGRVVVNGRRTGDTAEYSCVGEYELVGDQTRTCMSNSQWSGQTPSCQLSPVTVSFDPTTYTVTEGVDGVANLMLVRSGGLTRTVVVTVTTVADTATAGSDYTQPGVTTVTFDPDQTSASYPVPILDDSNIEDTEIFTASLSTTESGVTIGDDTATVTILDDDVCPDLTAPENGNVTVTGYRTGDTAQYSCVGEYELVGDQTRMCMSNSQWSGQTPSCQLSPVIVSFDPTTYTVTEGVDGVANLMLVRSGGLTRTVVVTVATVADTATAGSDYTQPGVTTVTFGPDVTSASYSVPILDDSDIENTEIFTASLSTTESGVNIGDDTATVTILDDDMCPDLTAPENGSVTVTGYRTGDTAEYSCDGGFELVGDQTRECMSNSQWSGQTPSCQISPVTVSFDPLFYTVTEGVDSVVNLTLVRSGGLTRTVVVSVNIASGTARAGSDYTEPMVTMVTFGPGVTRAYHSVPIVDDSDPEPDENFAPILSTTESNVNIGGDTAIVTILDDDLPCIQFEQTVYDVVEADEEVEVCVITCNDIGDRVIKVHVFGPNDEKIPPGAAIATPDTLDIFGLPMRARGSDYLQQVEGDNYFRDNDIVISAANPRICYNETIYDDILDEPMEYYGLTLLVFRPDPDDDDARIPPGYNTAAVRIVDDDEPDPKFEMTMYTVPENDRTVPLCIDIGVEILAPVTFTIDTAQKSPPEAEETDYTSGTTITVNPPGPRACIDFTDLVVDDSLAAEGVEAFAISIRGHGEMAMVTIIDDDEVSVGFDPTTYTIPEGNSGQLVIRKRGETEGPIEIFVSTSGGTATAGDDYNEITNERVVFNPGVSTQTVTLTTLSDALSEGDEDLTASITVAADSGIGVFDPEASVTITESDLARIMFKTESDDVVENRGSAEVCLELSSPTSTALNVNVTSIASGSATGGNDFVVETLTAMFAANSDTACVEFTVVDDMIALEGNETFTVTFTTPPGIIPGSPSTATVTIVDDDVLLVRFTEDDYRTREGESAEICVEGIGQIAQPAMATVSTTTDGTATANMDYQPLASHQVTFSVGPQTHVHCIQVMVLDDDVVEGEENFEAAIVSASPMPGVIIDTPNVTEVLIEDDDVVIGFEETIYSVNEEDGTAVVYVALLDGSLAGGEVEVTVVTVDGQAVAPDDYTIVSQTLTFNPSNTRHSVSIPITDDDVAESTERFISQIGGVTTTGVDVTLSPSEAIIEIIDRDGVQIGFEETLYTVSEDDGTIDVNVAVLSGSLSSDVVVTLVTQDAEAAAPGDYTGLTRLLTFDSSTTRHSVSIPITNDSVAESPETFISRLTGFTPSDAAVTLNPDVAVIQIIDDDRVQIGFEETLYTVSEDDGTVEVNVAVLSGSLSSAVVVTLVTQDDDAAAPGDYTSVTQMLTFDSSTTRHSVSIPITNDNVAESPEAFISQLTGFTPSDAAVVLNPNVTVIQIIDDDRPEPMFDMTMYTVPENDRTVPLCIDIGVEITAPITYTITTAQKSPPQAEESDFGTSAQITVNPPGGRTCIDFRDLVVDDNVALEGDEAFAIMIAGTSAMAMVTILDDDVPQLVPVSVSVQESDGIARPGVRLVNPIEMSFILNYTAADASANAGADYVSSSGQLEFVPNGETVMEIPIDIIVDSQPENQENLNVMFSFEDIELPPGVTPPQVAPAVVTIVDPDVAVMVNDTVIADPQFTVTLPSGSESMCYEVHGEAGKFFNLISDTCTSVNAHFTAMPGNSTLNRMSQIGIRAGINASSTGQCANIQINLENCAAFLDGNPIDGRDEIGDIRIRKMNNRWRVSVPNCMRPSAVMWITCDGNMLRFRIARNSGLTPTSHGLLGQFWNVPIEITTNEEDKTYIEIYEVGHASYRRIPAFEYSLTWDHTKMTCYYVGNSRGGPEFSHNRIESVIEGGQLDYTTDSLFATSYDYEMFDESVCS